MKRECSLQLERGVDDRGLEGVDEYLGLEPASSRYKAGGERGLEASSTAFSVLMIIDHPWGKEFGLVLISLLLKVTPP